MSDIINMLLTRLDISSLRFKRLSEGENKKPSLLKEVVNSPEKFKLEAFIEGDEIRIAIKRR